MGKTDTVIAAVGIAVLVAAAGGLLYVQEVAAVDTYQFPVAQHALGTQEAAVSGTTTLEWADVPDNATAATARATVAFQGQALTGGTVQVETALIAPDGTRQTERWSFEVPPAGTSATGDFELTVEWDRVPEAGRFVGTGLPAPRDAAGPLRLEVTVQAPGDAPMIAEYAFTVQAEATVDAYTAQKE